MFERYTEGARRAVFWARYAASESASDRIEAEHLLMGILKESPGSPAWAVERIRVELQARRKAERMPESLDVPLTRECKDILGAAGRSPGAISVHRLGQALMAVRSPRVGELLSACGITWEEAEAWVRPTEAHEERNEAPESFDEMWRVMSVAARAAVRRGSAEIELEHLMLGLLRMSPATLELAERLQTMLAWESGAPGAEEAVPLSGEVRRFLEQHEDVDRWGVALVADRSPRVEIVLGELGTTWDDARRWLGKGGMNA